MNTSLSGNEHTPIHRPELTQEDIEGLSLVGISIELSRQYELRDAQVALFSDEDQAEFSKLEENIKKAQYQQAALVEATPGQLVGARQQISRANAILHRFIQSDDTRKAIFAGIEPIDDTILSLKTQRYWRNTPEFT